MRVCILTTCFPLRRGAPEGIFIFDQARHLASLGVDVSVVAPHNEGSAAKETIDGVRVRRLRYMVPARWQTLCYRAGIPENLRRSLWAKAQLPGLITSLVLNTVRFARNSDVIFAHWELAGVAAILAGKVLRKPVVVMLHHGWNQRAKASALATFVARRADYTVFNSSATSTHVVGACRSLSWSIIPPGVDVTRFRPKIDRPTEFGESAGLRPTRPLLFAAGRLIECKGFTYLLRALALLEGERAPALWIAGAGPLRAGLEDTARKLKLRHRVRFLGQVPHEQLPSYFSAADVFVLPSVVNAQGETEGLGLVLAEAMACGTPCVASNVGGIPDLVKNGINGFLVPPADPQALAEKISLLLRDSALRERMGRQARAYVVENFSWEANAAKMLELFRAVIKRRLERNARFSSTEGTSVSRGS